MKKQELYNRILLSSLAALLLVGGVGVTLFPAPAFSEQENRMLTDFPAVSPEGLASGSYTAAIDTYLQSILKIFFLFFTAEAVVDEM